MQQFICKLCNYSTSNKANYNKHCNTKKHNEKSNKGCEKVSEKQSPKLAKTRQNSPKLPT